MVSPPALNASRPEPGGPAESDAWALLFEREREIEAITAALDSAASGRGRVVYIEGAAGIGKSALANATAEAARRRGMGAFLARGSELERTFPFGVALQLFERSLHLADAERRAALLAGPAALCAPLFGLGPTTAPGELPAPQDGEFARLRGLHWLIDNISAERPCLIAVDDAHWADHSSIDMLRFLAGRIANLPVVLLVVARGMAEVPGALLDVRCAPETVVLTPRGLTDAAMIALTRSLVPGAVDSVCETCASICQGNPLLLMELLRTVAVTGHEVDLDLGQLRAEAISRAVLVRLARLSPDAVSVARAVAVLDGNCDVDEAANVAGVHRGQGLEAADELRLASVVRWPADEPVPGRVEFVHPAIRDAVYAETPAALKERMHLRAAHALYSAGSPPGHVAAHLLRSAPSGRSWVRAVLLAAGERAVADEAFATATALLRRALREPMAPADRAAILLLLGRASWRSQSLDAADHLHAAAELSPRPEQRTEAALLLARVQTDNGSPDRAGLAVAQALRDDRAARLWWRPRGIDAWETAPPFAVPAALRAVVAVSVSVGSGPGGRAVELARAALPGRHGAGAAPDLPTLCRVATVLSYCGHPVEALATLDVPVAGATGETDRLSLDLARCVALREAGRLTEAASLARDVLERASALPAGLPPGMRAESGRALLAAGDLGGARAALPEPDGCEQHGFDAPIEQAMLAVARGLLALADGDAGAALRYGQAAGTQFASAGAASAAIVAPWRALCVRAAAALGDTARARAFAAEELAEAEAFGVARAVGAALRLQALVADDSTRPELLRRSLAALTGSGAQDPPAGEVAETSVELGLALLTAGEDEQARRVLAEAMEIATREGRIALADRAREALGRFGPRPRRWALTGPDSLTQAERRVAELAAQGDTNRAIAQRLVLSEKTVEFHLRNAFVKLSISSRRELAAQLSA